MHGPSNWPPASGFGGPPLWWTASDGAPRGPGFNSRAARAPPASPATSQPPPSPSDPLAGLSDPAQPPTGSPSNAPPWTPPGTFSSQFGNAAPQMNAPGASPQNPGRGSFNADTFAAFQGLDPNMQTALKAILGYK